MPLTVQAVSGDKEVLGPRPSPPRTGPRGWKIVTASWVLAIAAGSAAVPFSDRSFAADVLIGPVSPEGFQFLTLLATVLLTAAAICLTLSTLTRPPAPAWTRAVAAVVDFAVVGMLLLAAYPAFLIGALSFSTDYRTIGTIDGHQLVVARGIGLGDFPIRAGLRDGLFVHFGGTTGDTYTSAGGRLSEMRFRIADSADSVTVSYTPGPRPGHPKGVLVVPKTE